MTTESLGRAVLELSTDDKKLDRGLKDARRKFEGFSQRLGALGKNLTLSLTAPIAGFVALAVQSGNAANNILDLASVTGLSTDKVQALLELARQSGAPVDLFAQAMQRMALELQNTILNGDPLPEVFERLGVAAFDAAGQLRPLDDIMFEFMAVLRDIEDPTLRAALGVAVFSSEWRRIAPILDAGGTSLEEIVKQLREEGRLLSPDQLENLDAFRVKWEQLTDQLAVTKSKAMAPILEWFLDLPAPMQDTLVLLGGLLAIIGPVAFGLGALIPIIPPLVAGFSALAVAVGLSVGWLALIVVAVIALAVGIIWLVLNWETAWPAIKDAVVKAVNFIRDSPFKYLGLALGPLGWIAIGLLELWHHWDTIWGFFKRPVEAFVDFFKGAWETISGLFDKVVNAANRIGEFTSNPFGSIGDTIRGNIPGLAHGGIVTSPTLAMIGEAGPEAVVPLDGRGGMGGGEIHVHISGPVIGNDGGRWLAEELKRQLRRGDLSFIRTRG